MVVYTGLRKIPRGKAGDVKCYLTLELKDKNGQVTRRHIQESKSFVKQYLQLLLLQMGNLASISVTDTSGVAQSLTNPNIAIGCNDVAADATYGVLVGTGSAAPAATDNKMQTLIAHGAGAGQLSYGGMTISANVTVVGNTVSFTLARTFTNNSGASITVNEVGAGSTFSTSYKFLILHDLLTFTIANGGTATVTYTIQTTT